MGFGDIGGFSDLDMAVVVDGWVKGLGKGFDSSVFRV